MSDNAPDGPVATALTVDLSRRAFVAQAGLWAAVAAMATRSIAEQAGAQEATPVDPARLQGLLDLSKTLCGGGNFDPDRATMLLQFLAGDSDLSAGLDELLASPPVTGVSLGSSHAQATAQVILIFWYVGAFNGQPVPNRSTAYYGLTAWQAMYTPPVAVCKAFGGWADPPRTEPLVAND
ncbi:MAG: hypothetical protein QOF33_635 [Thermomicrobiales bacterium]|jgi:hypothetical protein|nr:hypothetical protein [Thermomicrobiales bacterium]